MENNYISESFSSAGANKITRPVAGGSVNAGVLKSSKVNATNQTVN